MLNTLRNAAGTWVAKILLCLLVLSFAAWGISGQIAVGQGNAVITVGDTTVSTQDYRLAYDREVAVMSQRLGTRLTREQAVAIGLDQQVLSQLVAGAVLDEQANNLGLGVSEGRVAQLTREDQAFHGPDGRFDRQRFEYVLRQVGMRPEDYLKNREQVAVRQQIVEAVSDGIAAPDAFLKAVALYRGEDRTIEYVVFPQSKVQPIDDPARKELEAYFEDHKSDYAAPEYRKFSYVKLEPSDIADEDAVLDDEISKYYKDNVSRYTEPEKRTIEQIVFGDEDAAKAALDSIRGGSTFEEVVSAEGKSMNDVKLGTFEKSKVADDAVAEAAFALDKNDVSDVVQGTFGPILVRVTDITPEVVKPLADVKDDIRRELALDEATRVIYDVYDSYEDARAGGATMQEAAKKLQLEVKTVDAVSRTGETPDGDVVKNLPESADLLREIYETDVDVDNPPLNIGSVGFVFYEVDDIMSARDRTLEEVHDKVFADWKESETESRLSSLVADNRKALDDGKSLDDIATEAGLQKDTKRGLKREADDSDLGKRGVAKVFSVAKGQSGVTPTAARDGQVLFQVTESFEPVGAGPDAVPENARTTFASGISDDLLDQLVQRLQGEYDISINRRLIETAMSF